MTPAMMRYFEWVETHVPWSSAVSSTSAGEGVGEAEGGSIVLVGSLVTIDEVDVDEVDGGSVVVMK